MRLFAWQKGTGVREFLGKLGWVVRVTVTAVAMSAVFTLVSSKTLAGAGFLPAVLALALFILVGILFDVVGVAVTAAREAPFHAMASHRERGAKEAIWLIRNANKVSSVCNDVVGDIAGIVSGTTAALIVGRLVTAFSWSELLVQLVISGLVTGLTIGGKAAGKIFALTRTTAIVLRAGQLVGIFRRRSK
jgi:CBS domain containing-hemolysin-like protein